MLNRVNGIVMLKLCLMPLVLLLPMFPILLLTKRALVAGYAFSAGGGVRKILSLSFLCAYRAPAMAVRSASSSCLHVVRQTRQSSAQK